MMVSNLIDKVPTGVNNRTFPTYALSSYSIFTDGKLIPTANTEPEHSTIDLQTGGVSGTVKAFSYLTGTEQLELSALFKEMIYDTGMSASTDATPISATTSQTFTQGVYYEFTDGIRKGDVFLCLITTTSTADNFFENTNDELIHPTNGNAYFKRWDGNGWGDDNLFTVASNTSTTTDDNGNTVLVGTKATKLPIVKGEV